MEKKPSMLQHTMTWGAITGIVVIIYSLLLYVFNQTYNRSLGLLSYVILIACIMIGSLAYRNKVLGGTISYGDAFMIGLLITVFAGIISSFFSFILVRFIDPGLVEQAITQTEEMLLEKGLSEDIIERSIERTRNMVGSPFSVIIGIFFFTLIGTVISLITAAIVKKEGTPFDGDAQPI